MPRKIIRLDFRNLFRMSRWLTGMVCVIFLSVSSVYSQDTVSIFFDLDKRELSDHSEIDALVSSLDNKEEVTLIGYADYLGPKSYNLLLSFDRAYHIAKYIRTKYGSKLIIEIEAKGELPPKGSQDAQGKPRDRRVDIVYGSSATPQQSATPITPTPVATPSQRPVVPPPVAADHIPEVIEIDTVTKENIVLEGLSFFGGRHYPLPESVPVLLNLVETMKEYQSLEIEIQGHICCNYEEEDGMDNDTGEPILSYNRARFVYEFLVENGIDSERMSYVGLGSTDPKVFPELTPEDQQANRRVELKIMNF